MFSIIDIVLISAVSAQCVSMAYLRNPSAKAIMMAIPFPVTLGILSVGHPVDITNVGGLLLSLAFTMTVLNLYNALKVRILFAITLAVLAYCYCGSLLTAWLPRTASSFWLGLLLVFIISGCVLHAMPPKHETPYRSPMPVWLKTILILGIVTSIVLLKGQLQGFMTTFPMLGVVASYETRKSLYTTSRMIPLTVTAFAVMFGICHVLQGWIGLYLALILGLAAYAAIVLFLKAVSGVKPVFLSTDTGIFIPPARPNP